MVVKKAEMWDATTVVLRAAWTAGSKADSKAVMRADSSAAKKVVLSAGSKAVLTAVNSVGPKVDYSAGRWAA